MVFCGNKEYDFVLYALLWEHNNLAFTERFQNNTQCVCVWLYLWRDYTMYMFELSVTCAMLI